MDEAITDEDFANLLTAADEEQPETDSDETTEAAAEEIEEQAETTEEEPEAEEEAEEETEEDESEDEQPQADSSDDVLEYEINGETVKATKDEAIQALRDRESMRADYTRKTQSLAQERQQFEQQQQEALRFQNTFAAEIGQIKAVQSQLQQYAQADWNQAFDSDPVQAAKAQAEYIRLQHEEQRLNAELGNKQRYLQAQEEAKDQKAIAEVWEHVQSKDSGFNRGRLIEMVQTASERYGADPKMLLGIRDPHLIEMWNDLDKKARAYDALQKTKPKAKAAVAASKVKQPAAAKPAQGKAKAIKKLSAKSSADDFAAALGASR